MLLDLCVRGILYKYISIGFYKDVSLFLKFKVFNKRFVVNVIISFDFKFEDMGIGGLDVEFLIIFRRVFVLCIFLLGLIEKLGIMYVKGMFFYGFLGIGKMFIVR